MICTKYYLVGCYQIILTFGIYHSNNNDRTVPSTRFAFSQSYSPQWNNRQKESSFPQTLNENLPFSYLNDSPQQTGTTLIDPANYYADWHRFLDGNSGQRCYDIPRNMTLCQNIGYSRMILPNFLQHEDLKEAVDQSHVWVSLAHTECHPDLRKFLCALYAPICVEEFQEQIIQPCNDLCEEVQQSCLPKMLQFGFGWPEIVKCSQFPVSSSKMCVPISKKARQQCSGCGDNPSFENIISSYCTADVVIRARLVDVTQRNSSIEHGYKLRVDSRMKIFKSNVPLGRWWQAILETNCQCDALERMMRHGVRRYGKWLIMGKLSKDYTHFKVEHMSRMRKQDSVLKNALNAMRQKNRDLCHIGLPKAGTQVKLSTASEPRHSRNPTYSMTENANFRKRLRIRDGIYSGRSDNNINGFSTQRINRMRSQRKKPGRSLVRRSQRHDLHSRSTAIHRHEITPNNFDYANTLYKNPPSSLASTILMNFSKKFEEIPVLESEKELFSPNSLTPWLT